MSNEISHLENSATFRACSDALFYLIVTITLSGKQSRGQSDHTDKQTEAQGSCAIGGVPGARSQAFEFPNLCT